MNDTRHKAQRLGSDVRIFPFMDQTDLLVLLVTGMLTFMIAGRLIANTGLKLVVVVAVVFVAYKLTVVVKKQLAPYPKALGHALGWSFTPDVLDVHSDPQPAPLYSGRPPLPD